MDKMWEKTNMVVLSIKEDGKECKRSFNNIAEKATDEQLQTFGDLVAQLTGEATDKVTVNVTTALA